MKLLEKLVAKLAPPKSAKTRSNSSTGIARADSTPDNDSDTQEQSFGNQSTNVKPRRSEKGHGRQYIIDPEARGDGYSAPRTANERNKGRAREITQKELSDALDLILPMTSGNGPELPDTSFDEISGLLQQAGMDQYSLRPRIYAVLRIMGSLNIMQVFIDDDIMDIALPFTYKNFPLSLSPSQRRNFLLIQPQVMTKAARIEGGLDSVHANLGTDADQYMEPIEELGKGGYGSVDKVRSKLSRKVFVRKRMSRSAVFEQDKRALRGFRNEIENLKRLSHHHLVRYVGSYTDPKWVGIIMEPVADCDLKMFLNRQSFDASDYECIRQAFGCLCAAIIYLQEMRCRHKDIKPQNILIRRSKVLITDFGLARDWTGKGRSTTSGEPGAFSPDYVAPEIVNQMPRNSSSDIWSLGCVFLDMMTILKSETLENKDICFQSTGTCGDNPRTNPEGYEKWRKHLKSKKKAKEGNHPLHWIKDMLQYDPRDRCTSHQLMETIREFEGYSGLCCDIEDDTSLPNELLNAKSDDDSESEGESSSESNERRVVDSALVEQCLCEAAETGDTNRAKRWLRVQLRLEDSRKANSKFNFKTAALHLAIQNGNNEIAKLVIAAGCDVNLVILKGRRNTTPLIEAIVWSNTDMLQHLILHNADLSLNPGDDSKDALLKATSNGDHESMRLLLDAGADVDARSTLALETSLFRASSQRDLIALRLLLAHGADTECRNAAGQTPLFRATVKSFHDGMRYLLESGAVVDPPTKAHVPPLFQACENGDLVAVKLLLSFGAESAAADNDGVAALHHIASVPAELASTLNHEQILFELLSHGAEINCVAPRAKHYSSTPLHLAVDEDRPDFVEVLLSHGADINRQTSNRLSWTPLHIAASRGYYDTARVLLKWSPNLEQPDSMRRTPLCLTATAVNRSISSVDPGNDVARLLLAAKCDPNPMLGPGLSLLKYCLNAEDFAMYSLLVEHGADINAIVGPPNFRNTEIHWAAQRDGKTFEFLLEQGANIETRNSQGMSPLMVAARANAVNNVRLLLQKGAKIDASDQEIRFGPFANRVAGSTSAEVLTEFLQHGMDLSACTKTGRSPLAVATNNSLVANMRLLLENGADLSCKDPDFGTILHRAAARCSAEGLSLLLSHGADHTATNATGYTPLMLAVQFVAVDNVQMLLEQGADANAITQDSQNGTAMHMAASRFPPKGPKILALLLKHGGNISAITKDKRTPLMLASMFATVENMRFLLEQGADIHAQDADLATAAILFRTRQHNQSWSPKEAISLFLEFGADLSAADKWRVTPLQRAASRCDVETMRLLLEHGVDVNIKDFQSNTALHFAARLGPTEAVELLLLYGADVFAMSDEGLDPLRAADENVAANISGLILSKIAERLGFDRPETFKGLVGTDKRIRGNTEKEWRDVLSSALKRMRTEHIPKGLAAVPGNEDPGDLQKVVEKTTSGVHPVTDAHADPSEDMYSAD